MFFKIVNRERSKTFKKLGTKNDDNFFIYTIPLHEKIYKKSFLNILLWFCTFKEIVSIYRARFRMFTTFNQDVIEAMQSDIIQNGKD